MGLPVKVFYGVQDVAARWDCRLTDLGGWASIGRFAIITPIASNLVPHQRFKGFVEVPVGDVMPLFRQGVRVICRVRLGGIRPLDQDAWIEFASKGDAPEVQLEDLLILAEDVHRFEVEHDLLRRPAAAVGAPTRYDWESMYIAQIIRIHDRGVPESQTAWVGEVQEWFAGTKGGDRKSVV